MRPHWHIPHIRKGVTLTEVLVAIFIMGIGLLSLLTLFPLGALQMAQAIHDDRCTHAAMNARALGNMAIPYGGTNPCTLKDDPYTVFPYYYSPYSSISTNNTNPLPNPLPPTAWGLPLPLPTDGPSYPVFIDPVGVSLTMSSSLAKNGVSTNGFAQFYTLPASTPYWVTAMTSQSPPIQPSPGIPLGYYTAGTTTVCAIPRVAPSFMYSANGTIPFNNLVRWCMMLDDVQFDSNGMGLVVSKNPNLIQREDRYSWAWFCRQIRPTNTGWPASFGVDMTVVVYERRPMTTGASGAPLGETTYAAQFNYGSNLALLKWGPSDPAPNLKRGTWILDATMRTPNAAPTPGGLPALDYVTLKLNPGGGNNGKPNGYFYRIVNTGSVVPDGKGNNMVGIELHMNARASSGAPVGSSDQSGPGYGVAVVMENVAEVYEKGPNTPQ